MQAASRQKRARARHRKTNAMQPDHPSAIRHHSPAPAAARQTRLLSSPAGCRAKARPTVGLWVAPRAGRHYTNNPSKDKTRQLAPLRARCCRAHCIASVRQLCPQPEPPAIAATATSSVSSLRPDHVK
eukprot:scaffold24279_cov112-Isochrysis_galbana.AAC.2